MTDALPDILDRYQQERWTTFCDRAGAAEVLFARLGRSKGTGNRFWIQ